MHLVRMSSSREPRRQPTQARSRDTVNVILTAVEQLAATHGIEKISVSQIVRRAGVTLGTFYQYFSGLDSVIAAWEERELESDTALLMKRVADYAERLPPYETIIREIVELCFDVFLRRRAFFQMPAGADFMSRRRARAQLADNAVTMMAAAMASAPGTERLRGTNYEEMLRCVFKATTNIAFDTAISNLSDRQMKSLREEMVKMVTLYLIREPALDG
jgi:AcrR family transcriptional regulator